MNVNEYYTTDISKASVLLYFEHTLSFVDKTEYRAKFCFVKQANTACILEEYDERVLQVEPYAFFQCLKEMKERLYND